jgi:hypothetical protein
MCVWQQQSSGLESLMNRFSIRKIRNGVLMALATFALFSVACSSTPEVQPVVAHIDAETGISFAVIDRFSDDAGTVFRRSENPDLPAPNEPIDYDADFLSHALSPDGEDVSYYAFDVAPLKSAPVYSFYYESDPEQRVEGQSPIFDQVPGDEGYNDFWQAVHVLVPDDFELNSIRSLEQLDASGFEQVRTGTIINCPIVPYGSTAELAERSSVGWYRGELVQYFVFDVQRVSVVGDGDIDVPYAVVRVIFEDNDPSKGMKIDSATGKTHNVFDTIPGDRLYRALWRHDFVDEASFDSVHDWDSSKAAPKVEIDMDNILVNCPVVIWPGSDQES